MWQSQVENKHYSVLGSPSASTILHDFEVEPKRYSYIRVTTCTKVEHSTTELES